MILRPFVVCIDTYYYLSVAKLQLVHILFKVGKSHEGGPFILRKIRTYSTRVATSTCIQKDTELVIIDFFGTAANLSKELLHIYGKLELLFNYLN